MHAVMKLGPPASLEYVWRSGMLKPSLASWARYNGRVGLFAIIVFPAPHLALGDWT